MNIIVEPGTVVQKPRPKQSKLKILIAVILLIVGGALAFIGVYSLASNLFGQRLPGMFVPSSCHYNPGKSAVQYSCYGVFTPDDTTLQSVTMDESNRSVAANVKLSPGIAYPSELILTFGADKPTKYDQVDITSEASSIYSNYVIIFIFFALSFLPLLFGISLIRNKM